jgi:hypothetical protein
VSGALAVLALGFFRDDADRVLLLAGHTLVTTGCERDAAAG